MLDKETAHRIMIMRVREWDERVEGSAWFDKREVEVALNMVEGSANAWVQRNPEAGLSHG